MKNIKKSLVEKGSFSQAENDYLDLKYDEHKRIDNTKS
jgi:hypothetical protein